MNMPKIKFHQNAQRRNIKQMDHDHKHTITQLFYATKRCIKTNNAKNIIKTTLGCVKHQAVV